MNRHRAVSELRGGQIAEFEEAIPVRGSTASSAIRFLPPLLTTDSSAVGFLLVLDSTGYFARQKEALVLSQQGV